MLKKFKVLTVCFSLVLSILFWSCDDGGDGATDTTPCPTDADITILAPADGSTYSVGDTITVQWCFGNSNVEQVFMQYFTPADELNFPVGFGVNRTDATEFRIPIVDAIGGKSMLGEIELYVAEYGNIDNYAGPVTFTVTE